MNNIKHSNRKIDEQNQKRVTKIFSSWTQCCWHDVAKAISFLLGTVVAFVINKYWTFEKHEKSYKEMLQFGILYSTTLGANVLTNKIVLSKTEIVFLAFIIATGVSTVLNFIGQKWWVFR